MGTLVGGTSKRCSVCVHLRVSRQVDAPEQKSKITCAFSLLLPLRGRKWGWGGILPCSYWGYAHKTDPGVSFGYPQLRGWRVFMEKGNPN